MGLEGDGRVYDCCFLLIRGNGMSDYILPFVLFGMLC